MRLLALLLVLLSFPAEASRGCGATKGVGTTDAITSTYATGFSAKSTYAFWMNVNGAGGNSGGRVMNKGGTATTVDAIQATPTVIFNPAFSTTRGQFQQNTGIVATGGWHHVAITYDGSSVSNVAAIYIDGASVGVTVVATPVGTRTTDANAYVICNTSAGNRNFDGMLADYVMWNDILTQNEITALAKGAPPLTVHYASLVFYLPFYGTQSGEQDWGPSHKTQTLTGTAVQPTKHPAIQMFRYQRQ